jgi:hypothetical protein
MGAPGGPTRCFATLPSSTCPPQVSWACWQGEAAQGSAVLLAMAWHGSSGGQGRAAVACWGVTCVHCAALQRSRAVQAPPAMSSRLGISFSCDGCLPALLVLQRSWRTASTCCWTSHWRRSSQNCSRRCGCGASNVATAPPSPACTAAPPRCHWQALSGKTSCCELLEPPLHSTCPADQGGA